MSSDTSLVEPATDVRPAARAAFGVNAAIAWASLALSFALSAWAVYPSGASRPSDFGWNADGAAGAPGRILDWLSYFTMLSNVVVAVTTTMLARNPDLSARWKRVLRLDGLLMITVTGLVYSLVLAPSAHPQGWSVVSTAGLHYVTPVLTVVVWLVFGPRGRLSYDLIPAAMVIPVVWLAWTLLRGAVIQAYPYGFVDVAVHGYGTVLINVLGIVLLGVGFAAAFVAIDRLLTDRRGRS